MSLNTETLNTILAPYVRSLTDGETAENGVWEAINCFGTNWDIDAVDFPAMFAQATQQARAVMDTPTCFSPQLLLPSVCLSSWMRRKRRPPKRMPFLLTGSAEM